jgi:hypothetical protein
LPGFHARSREFVADLVGSESWQQPLIHIKSTYKRKHMNM